MTTDAHTTCPHPGCGETAFTVARSFTRQAECERGHRWHRCPLCGVKLLGRAPLTSKLQCCCPQKQRGRRGGPRNV